MSKQLRCWISFAGSAAVASLSLLSPVNAQSNPPTSGTFHGRGIVSGSVFTQGRQADAVLNMNQGRFSLSFAATAVRGMEVNYNGTIIRRRAGSSRGRNGFVLETQVRTFASSSNGLRVTNTSGGCRIEVFDARIISSSCNTNLRNSSTRFQGMVQF